MLLYFSPGLTPDILLRSELCELLFSANQETETKCSRGSTKALAVVLRMIFACLSQDRSGLFESQGTSSLTLKRC